MAKGNNNGVNLGFESELWRAADALRSNMDAAEYKHVVLGLIFLKYISDSFEKQHSRLEEDIRRIADTYHACRADTSSGDYEDVPRFCKGATLDDIRHNNHIITPGRYVGGAEVEDDTEPFQEKMSWLTAQLRGQIEEGIQIDETARKNLEDLGYGI